MYRPLSDLQQSSGKGRPKLPSPSCSPQRALSKTACPSGAHCRLTDEYSITAPLCVAPHEPRTALRPLLPTVNIPAPHLAFMCLDLPLGDALHSKQQKLRCGIFKVWERGPHFVQVAAHTPCRRQQQSGEGRVGGRLCSRGMSGGGCSTATEALARAALSCKSKSLRLVFE